MPRKKTRLKISSNLMKIGHLDNGRTREICPIFFVKHTVVDPRLFLFLSEVSVPVAVFRRVRRAGLNSNKEESPCYGTL